MKTLEITKEEALAKFLNCGIEEISVTRYDEDTFDAPGGDYMVLTDEEANQKARDYILDSAWAFNKSFLNGHSEAISNIPDKDYNEMAGRLRESFNKAVLAMIDDEESFIDDAIASDGRGHFLSTYDSEENEQGEYFIYRVN